MARYLFLALLMLHGALHLIGFFTPVLGRTLAVNRQPGIYWAACTVLLWLTAVLMLLHQRHWPWMAIAAALGSQLLIASAWEQARFGTIVNAIVLVAVLLRVFVREAPAVFRD